MKEKIKELRLQGKGYKTIAKELGITRNKVQNISVSLGLGGKLSPYVNQHGSDEDRERYFKEQFESKYPGFLYHSGYTTIDGYFNMECKICGHIQTRNAQKVRPSRDKGLVCDNCTELERNQKEALLKEKRETQKEQKRNEILLDQLIRREVRSIRSIRDKHKELNECVVCGRKFFSNKHKATCSVKCRNKKNYKTKDVMRRMRYKENGSFDNDITVEKLMRRDKNKCHICGKKCDNKDYEISQEGHFIVGRNYPSIDHLIPISKGGTHTWGNVKLAHHYCNTIKNNNETFIDDKGQVVLAV